VAGVLTHRLASSTAAPDESGLRSALSVLRAHLARAQLPAQASIDDTLYRNNPRIPRSPHSFAARLRWQAPEPAPRVSIIVPTRDAADLLRTCIDSILERTRYPGHEILIVDHQSTAPEARRYLDTLAAQPNVSIIPYTGAFNWSAMNNLAVSHAKGEVLCFLNNDTEILSPDWLSELVGHAMRPEVGAVGAKLVLRDGTLQHGGVVLGVHGVAEHAFSGLPADEAGYMMRAGLTQNLSAVTGACLVCRREVFDAVGGFEMAHRGVAFNDVDFCLRLAQSGYRVVWTPHVRICHEGSTTRGRDWAGEQRSRLDQEMAYMRERWGAQLARDPHYHPAFERYEPPYAALTGAYRPPLARQ
jgi:GT2 family glycosyltransferase